MQALGLIETRGLLSAIESLDVMLKTAQVELVERSFVGGGLVTIAVTGDVGAVKAAVEAGVAAVKKIDCLSLVSQHIIPRPHYEVESMLTASKNSTQEQVTLVVQPEEIVDTLLKDEITEVDITIESISSTQIMPKDLHKEGVDAFVQEFGIEESMNLLKALSVVKLRNLAREYKELDLVGRAISKANKELLIQKLKGYYDMVSNR